MKGPTLSLRSAAVPTSIKMESRSAFSSRDNEELATIHRESKQDDPAASLSNNNGVSTASDFAAGRRSTKATDATGKAGAAPPRPNKIRSTTTTKQQMSPNKNRAGLGNAGNNSNMTRPAPIITPQDGQQLETILGGSSLGGSPEGQQQNITRPAFDSPHQEQLLFEKRLCEDSDGVAVKKINQNGKTSLRYIRSLTTEEVEGERKSSRSTRSSSSRSANSRGRRGRAPLLPQRDSPLGIEKSNRLLVWGKKKDVQIPLERFVAVQKGKTTDRAKRNTAFRSLVLSLITNDPDRPALDIEAPTKMDRDKFARAFARFLEVPLIEEDSTRTLLPPLETTINASAAPTAATLALTPTAENANATYSESPQTTSPIHPPPTSREATLELAKAALEAEAMRHSAPSAPQVIDPPKPTTPEPPPKATVDPPRVGGFYPPPLPPNNLARDGSDHKVHGSYQSSQPSSTNRSSSNRPVVSVVEGVNDEIHETDLSSHVSSITAQGYDHELVEELHHALNDMRAELEESRAEAARAVKVAEQAIQSAERSNSAEWQNTVTHKAAEAAAMAQKRSAEAMAKQRLAEGRLESEKRTAAFWRKQAQVAEEEAGSLQTRAAAAEVQKAVMEAQLETLRRNFSVAVQTNQSAAAADALGTPDDSLQSALEKNRLLEEELERARQKMRERGIPLDESTASAKSDDSDSALVSNNAVVPAGLPPPRPPAPNSQSSELLLKIHAEATLVREEYEQLKKETSEELKRLPQESQKWVGQVLDALKSSQAETKRMRQRLAFEMSSRRKLLNEVQDLRGTVRVYCRPRSTRKGERRILSLPSHETITLKRSKRKGSAEMSFEFDRVFEPSSSQHDVYSEVGETCLGVLEGYNVAVLAYGRSGCGKTHTLLGDISTRSDGSVSIENHGIQLQAMQQLFSIAEHRRDRFKDVFTLTIIEVFNERLTDLVAGTNVGDTRGETVVADTKGSSRRKGSKGEDDTSSGKPTKLEIRTDLHGETVVQGLTAIEVSSFDDACSIWCECIQARQQRLADLDVDMAQYEASSTVIAALKVKSANIATGLGIIGKIQFVDLASADLTPRGSSTKSSPAKDLLPMPAGDKDEWKFANRSIETLNEVVVARMEFNRSVPYRNSTLTHLLRDSLDHDTKVLLVACLPSEAEHVHEIEATLRFASSIRRVNIGKATKHTLSPP